VKANKGAAGSPRNRTRNIALSTGAVLLLSVTAQGLTVQEIGVGPLKVHLKHTEYPLPSPSSPLPQFGVCTIAKGSPGTVQPAPEQVNGLSFCPVQINDGSLPIARRRFDVQGQILGPVGQRESLALIVYGDPKTCDTLGNPPSYGGFLADDFEPASSTGAWSYIDDFGYDEAVSIGRTYKYAKVSESALDAMRRDRADWNAANPGQANNYPGILKLPNGVDFLSTFYVPGNPTVKRKKACGI